MASMNKHIFSEHPITWWSLNNFNLMFVTKITFKKRQAKIWYWFWGHHKTFWKCLSLQNNYVQQKKFMEDLLIFVAKGCMHIFVVESQWLKCLVMSQNLWIMFLNKKTNGSTCHPFIGGQDHGPLCDANFGFLHYNNCFFLNLWMSNSRHYTFTLAINFINSLAMVPCHVIMGLFEAIHTIGVIMTTHVVKEPSNKLYQMGIKKWKNTHI